MAYDVERQWICHPDTGGTFECPVDALPAWLDKGWEPCDPPEEPNPAIAERQAWERQQEDESVAAAGQVPTQTTATTETTGAGRRGDETQES